MLIADDDGNELPAGEQGEVWLRSTTRDTPSYRYVGAEARTRDGGWESLGDVGWLDDDGFLYLGDRLTDMILSGGANIYPAEVEAAIQEHPDVRSSAVVGLPDDDLGQRVHAIVEADAALDVDGVLQHLRDRLAPYKLPRTFEFVDEPLRDDAGKVRRSALRAQRLWSLGRAARCRRMPRRPRQAKSAMRRATSSAGSCAPPSIQSRLAPSARPTRPWASWRRCVHRELLDVDERGDRFGDGPFDDGDLRGELLVAPGAPAEEHAERGLVRLHEPEVGDEAELDLLVG